jgi:hypothetical protein
MDATAGLRAGDGDIVGEPGAWCDGAFAVGETFFDSDGNVDYLIGSVFAIEERDRPSSSYCFFKAGGASMTAAFVSWEMDSGEMCPTLWSTCW